jgi:hypothetical protein
LEGSVTLSVDIDQNGKVERSALKIGCGSVLDSIAIASIKSLCFAPAFEQGKAAPSTVSLQMVFILDSMVAASRAALPDIEGVVADQKSKLPIANTIVNLEFTDTISDPSLSIGFHRYLSMIGKLPGQTLSRGMLSTVTDNAGRFAFRLLPFCPAKIAVLADGYEIADFYEHPKPEIKLVVRYFLETIVKDTARFDSSNSITVYGRAPASHETINVERTELARGLTHSASKLLLSQSTIRQMPEGPSALLVRSGSPFDNRYLIAGVPFLAPFHFGGYPYGDIDGMMVSALSDIKVGVDDIAGRYAGVSGALIEANPGIYRPAIPNLVPRPELAIDYGWLGCDLLFSVPTDKSGKDVLQIGYTSSDSYFLKWLYGYYGMNEMAALDLGQPQSFYNVTVNDSKRIGQLQFNSFGWLAGDSYIGREKNYPWGMGSVTVHPVDRNNLTLSCGGSHQYFAKGKLIGNTIFLTKSYLSNGTLDFNNDSIPIESAIAGFGCRLDYQTWDGSVERNDSLILPVDARKGKESNIQAHGSIEQALGNLRIRARILGDGIIDNNKTPDLSVDGGISLCLDRGDLQTELNLGRVTTRPDIRGLPDSSFRLQRFHSYLVSIPIHYRNSYGIEIGMQPYLRYQDKCPQLNPLDNIWDSSSTSPLFARGIDINGEAPVLENLSFNGVINLEDAKRVGAAEGSIYEWNVPWSVRGGAHYSLFHKSLHLYLDYVLTNGLPYFNFNTNAYLYLPAYRCMDFSIQYRTIAVKHRYLTRYDGYFGVRNLFDRVNVREYYWNYLMQKRPIYLCPFCIDAGVRIGLRL